MVYYSAALGKPRINETVHTPICTSYSEGSQCHALLPGEGTAINRGWLYIAFSDSLGINKQ